MPQYDMSLTDLRRELKRFRFDPKYKGTTNGLRMSIAGFAQYVGLSRQTVYVVMRQNCEFRLTPYTKSRLVHGILMVMNGLRWRRRNRVWEPHMLDGSVPTLRRPTPPPEARA